jgi:hypothetical protein
MKLRASVLEKGLENIDPKTLELIPPDQDPAMLAVQEMGRQMTEAMQTLAQVGQVMGQAVQQMQNIAAVMAAPRETQLVRDRAGKAQKSISRLVS